jgi:hypothetical protein
MRFRIRRQAAFGDIRQVGKIVRVGLAVLHRQHKAEARFFGSYAEARAKNDPSLGIAYPKDYVLVLSRVSFISLWRYSPGR